MHAARYAAPGGRILYHAGCREGVGSAAMARWLARAVWPLVLRAHPAAELRLEPETPLQRRHLVDRASPDAHVARLATIVRDML